MIVGDSVAGTVRSPFDQQGFAPRWLALGDAGTLATGVAAMHYNPAGLAGNQNSEWSTGYRRRVEGIQDFSAGIAWSDKNQPSGNGLLVQQIQYGATDRTRRDGFTIINDGRFYGSETAVSLGTGWAVQSGLLGTYHVGALVRWDHRIIDHTSASLASLALGIRKVWIGGKLGIGGSLRGITVRKDSMDLEQQEHLPRMRVGLRYNWSPDRLRWEGWFTLDLEHTFVNKTSNASQGTEPGRLHPLVGIELVLPDNFSLRAGLDPRDRLDSGYRFGFGWVEGDLGFDYALIPSGPFGVQHVVGLSRSF